MADSILDKIGFTINLLVNQLGTALFIPMVYVIVKYKKLHDSPCLKLIGIFMLACLCSKFVIIFPYLVRVLPLSNVPLILCFAIQIVPALILSDIVPIILSMAFDRCLSVFFPFWYCQKQKRLYFSALCIFFVVYALYTQIVMFWHVFSHPMIQTNCTTPELHGSISLGLPDFGPYMNYLTIFFYFLMAVKLFWAGRDGRNAYFKRQPIFVSFAVTIFIQVIGTWLIGAAYTYIPGWFAADLTENEIPLVFYGINCFSSLFTTIQFFGIYINSVEHRMALKETFPRMFQFFPSKGVQQAFCGSTNNASSVQVKPVGPQQHISNVITINNNIVKIEGD